MSARDAFAIPFSPTAGRPARADGLAYATLERARLGCERLLQRARTPVLVRLLRAAHRELGMAAYRASGQLPTVMRQHLQASARRDARAAAPPATCATDDVVVLSIRGAALTSSLRADPEFGDEVSSAYHHALDAMSALAVLVGTERAQALCLRTMRQGQLESDQLRVMLSSIAATRPAASRHKTAR